MTVITWSSTEQPATFISRYISPTGISSNKKPSCC